MESLDKIFPILSVLWKEELEETLGRECVFLQPWGLGMSPDTTCQPLDMEDARVLQSMRLKKQMFQNFAACPWGRNISAMLSNSDVNWEIAPHRKENLMLGAEETPANPDFVPFTHDEKCHKAKAFLELQRWWFWCYDSKDDCYHTTAWIVRVRQDWRFWSHLKKLWCWSALNERMTSFYSEYLRIFKYHTFQAHQIAVVCCLLQPCFPKQWGPLWPL